MNRIPMEQLPPRLRGITPRDDFFAGYQYGLAMGRAQAYGAAVVVVGAAAFISYLLEQFA